MALCARALRPGGIAIVFCDHRRIPDLMYAATTSGLRYAATVAWVHNQPSTGGIFRASWNPVLVFSRGTPDRVDRSAKADGRDVIEAKRVSKRSHPHQKPAAVYEHILARVCRPGDLVLNPFAGSASSREAAEKLGLRWAAATWTPPTRRRARA
jgi:site-specific DNA-methyltransferase (adenine-specific)